MGCKDMEINLFVKGGSTFVTGGKAIRAQVSIVIHKLM